jgi:hypothetical protein
MSNPVNQVPFIQNYPQAPQPTTITTSAGSSASSGRLWISSGTGATVQMSNRTDPDSWVGIIGNTYARQSEMSIGDWRIQTSNPPPNFIRRLIWKWALGVTWRDLRPERDMETLKGLK